MKLVEFFHALEGIGYKYSRDPDTESSVRMRDGSFRYLPAIHQRDELPDVLGRVVTTPLRYDDHQGYEVVYEKIERPATSSEPYRIKEEVTGHFDTNFLPLDEGANYILLKCLYD